MDRKWTVTRARHDIAPERDTVSGSWTRGATLQHITVFFDVGMNERQQRMLLNQIGTASLDVDGGFKKSPQLATSLAST